MSKEWTRAQWAEWHKLVEWSHKAGDEGAKKLLDDAGMPQRTLPCHVVFNVQDAVAFALRRGAIRMLNQLNGIEESEGGRY